MKATHEQKNLLHHLTLTAYINPWFLSVLATRLATFYQRGILILLPLHLDYGIMTADWAFSFPRILLFWLPHLYFLPGYWPISILLNKYKSQLFTGYKTIVPQHITPSSSLNSSPARLVIITQHHLTSALFLNTLFPNPITVQVMISTYKLVGTKFRTNHWN